MTTKKAKKAETQSILDYFANLPDPRRDNENRRHNLIDIIAIATLATICGAGHFTEMEEWGEANEDWLRTFLELPNGIPSHDTFGNVFAKLDPAEFKKCFISWVEAIRTATDGEVIAIDGKTLRRSHNRRKGVGAIHLVSAWARRNRLTLGQVKVDGKSNEITAIPELLRLLHIKGCIVTIDAMGTQKEIAELICAHALITFWRSRIISRICAPKSRASLKPNARRKRRSKNRSNEAPPKQPMFSEQMRAVTVGRKRAASIAWKRRSGCAIKSSGVI